MSKTTSTKQKGEHLLQVKIEGEGPVAEMIKDLLNYNFTTEIDKSIGHEACIQSPRSPDWANIFFTIYFPLIAMFLLQVLFNFVIRRIVLFFVLPYVFRKRSKARIIQLYNKLLFGRINERKLARARIREAVRRKQIQKAKGGQLFPDNGFFKPKILDFIFKTDD
uniref:Dendritic cell-specific transmembrane protein-like domain-containing protein n=1 Tax=Panagrolaimus sp. PS1159 TaxID=55785 RepID=A0AC35FDM5_9BILA